MRVTLACFILALSGPALAQSNLPNADLPGNSASLPNSNMPGSLPTENPITLPDTDTSKAVTPYDPTLFDGSNVPVRNPTEWPRVPTPSEQAVEQAQRETIAAREQAARAQEEVETARQEALAARQEAAAARQEAAAARAEAAASAPPDAGTAP